MRFCPMCATPLERTERHGEARPRCPACGWTQYNNPRPTASVLVVRDGRVLLGRRATDPYQGWWDIVGGFLEGAEHPEDGARREVREETGLTVGDLELLGIWMDRYGDDEQAVDTLNIFYLAESPAGAVEPADDVSELAWFGPDTLPERVAFEGCRQALATWRERVQDQ
jgi:8-oxo-dGTP diphosphatase